MLVESADEPRIGYSTSFGAPGDKTIASIFEDKTVLGRGIFAFSLVRSKKTRGNKAVKVTIKPEITTDYEIIPHRFDDVANRTAIEAFTQKYIFKPYTLGENKVGIELNFNKEFYVPEKLESVDDILAELKTLDAQLAEVKI